MPIHPTAIVHPRAELDSSVEVGPHAIIDEHVRIGAGTVVGPNAYLTGYTEIGCNNRIHIGAILGHEPQDVKFDRTQRTYLRIGDGNVFREYCTVHRGTAPETATVIGNNCFLMGGCHIGHNCVLGNQVIVANAALLAGHVVVGDRAFISGGVVIHQFTRLGRLVMVSGNARLSMDVPPFLIATERNEVHALNSVGLRRAGISAVARSELKRLFRLFFHSGLNVSQALAAAETAGFSTPEAREFLEFVRSSENGICQPPR